ncbi:MAG: hypothetical protein J0H06_10445, partial [Actinobacteria bacterium]|nr:hypothetical protein [Actinomycetota bacterium]
MASDNEWRCDNPVAQVKKGNMDLSRRVKNCFAVAGFLVLASVVLAACGGGSSSSGATSAGSEQ